MPPVPVGAEVSPSDLVPMGGEVSPEMLGDAIPSSASSSAEPTNATGRFLHGLWEHVNPSALLDVLASPANALLHPKATAQGISQQNHDLYQKAKGYFEQGDYSRAIPTALNYLLNGVPGLGSAIQKLQEQGDRGDVAGEVGGSLGLGAQVIAAPKVAATAASKIADLPAVAAATAARGTTSPGAGKLAVDLTKAMPPTKTAPYSPADIIKSTPYLAAEHAQTPIASVEGLREAADSAITQIEEHVGRYIEPYKTDLIRTDPYQAAKSRLAGSVNANDLKAGLKELDGFGLDQPLTLGRADALRLRLNAENQAVLAKNHYDHAVARKVDPAFAAREAAVAALRDGIYDQLGERGIQGVRELRQDEGALIRLRDAALTKQYAGGATVAGTGANSLPAKIARAGMPVAGSALGASAGGPVGAAAGVVIGHEIARTVVPPNMTRDALVERAMNALPKGARPSYPVPSETSIRGLLPSAPVASHVPDTSFVRAVPAQAELSRGTRALPSSTFQRVEAPMNTDASRVTTIPARGLVVRDPATGRFKRIYTTEGAP